MDHMTSRRIARGLGLLCADHAPKGIQEALAVFLEHPDRLQELGAMLISATESGMGGVYCHEALTSIYAEYERLAAPRETSD